MAVDPGIGERGVFVAAEREDRCVHGKRFLETALRLAE